MQSPGVAEQSSQIRALFKLPADVTYLNCANMAPQMKTVHEAGMRALERKDKPWELTDWFSDAEKLRSLAAQIIGTDGDGVALVPAASYGIAVAAANLPMQSSQTVVVMHHEFPSNYYSWEDLANRRGGHVAIVKRQEGESWTSALLSNIASNTAIVAISPCHWTDGSAVDLARVSERVRAVGAALVIDASQALGAMPIDLNRVQPDFLVSVGYKWMLGPYGLGYLYVAPRWRNGVPLERSWLTRAGSEDFTRLVDRTDEFRPGARRYDMGEFPQFHTAPMAIAALEQLVAWSVPQIAKGIEVLTDRVAQRAQEQGFAVLPKQERVSHMIGIRKAGGVPTGLPGFLRERKLFVSIRGDAIRIAPHLYNSLEDVDRSFDAIAEFQTRSASV